MNSCGPIRDSLAQCLLASPQVQQQGMTAHEALKEHMSELPEECRHLYKSYVSCKRGMLDMRKRFRGNAPPAASGNNNPGGTNTISPETPVEDQK